MDRSSRYYGKAMKNYQKGNLEKALYFCEKSMSTNLKNSSSLNLKGLLLYLKGELDEAEGVWKLNRDYNKDAISRKYLSDLKSDRERLYLYQVSLELIKELKVNQALEILKKVEESDFNVINVSNAIADTYIKLGAYDEAKKYVDKALTYNNKDAEALENKRILKEYGFVKSDEKQNRWYAIIAIIGILGIFLYAGKEALDIMKKNNANKVEINQQVVPPVVDTSKDEMKDEAISKSETSKQENSQRDVQDNIQVNKEEPFPIDKINSYIDEGNFDELDNIVSKFKDKDISTDEKAFLNKAIEALRRGGVEKFYAIGSSNLNENNVEKAIESFEKAKAYGEGHYLYPHILFMLGTSYEIMQKFDLAIVQYELYYNKYPEGNYIGETLYKLALIYSNIDKDKAKYYGKEIREKQGNSIYNNSKIDEIMK